MPIPSSRCLTISSGKAAGLVLAGALFAPLAAWADDDIAFDRPGIAFGTDVLAPGQFAWEQGLPDYSRDDSGGATTGQYTLDSRLRLGLGARLELQVAVDSYVWQHGDPRAHGGGDSQLALKWALPSSNDDFAWALLGTYSAGTGRAAFSEGAARDVGMSLAWSLPQGRGVGLYLDVGRGSDGTSWMVSPNYTLHDDGRWMTYVEAGFAGGAEHERQLGGGVAWHLRPKVQLDASLLRGLDAGSTDWQAGLGISFAL
ncbi:transporter [Stenotrophomonas panacihumi]|uniref:transporter n=1 Tax=Stenotrophomonas panacihumi TaxID=676599 RepID=UPI0009D6C2C4|nr:transporter [Stenotrophomonas panacihumi]PTN53424.1 transporter [Stenotrophomonas panacihumi]